MAGSLYAGKILIGGTTVLVGTVGSVYLAKDHIWAKNELKDLTFLPWDCRKEGATSCKLKVSDLKNIPFKLGSSISKPSDTVDSANEATLKWNPRSKDMSHLDLLFTITSTQQIDLKKGSDTISISANQEPKFQLKKVEDKNEYFFEKSKLTSHDLELIEEIKKLDKYTISTSGQKITATPATTTPAPTVSSISIDVTSSSTDANKKIELKVEITSSDTNRAMTSWECTIQKTAASTGKSLSTEQINSFKKSFGIIDGSGGSSQKDWTEKHKKSMGKFIEKCAESSSTESTPSNKKLTRTITSVELDETESDLKFKNLEDFFIPA